MVIHKYDVESGSFECTLTEGAIILDVQTQRGRPVMWVLIDQTITTRVQRRFRVLPTGLPFVQDDRGQLSYLGTFQIPEENLVFHVFEEL